MSARGEATRPIKRRRSLTHVGGAVEVTGDAEMAVVLAQALDVTPAPEPLGRTESTHDDPDRAHVHGFHAYPARLHPATAARLVCALSEQGASLLDPFCGSGTVLVEAMIAGRRGLGVDLNPIAVCLSRVKTGPRDARTRESIVSGARSVAAFADARRERRAGATRRYPAEDVAAFDPHVLLELDSLRAGIATRRNEDAHVHRALQMVLSSILVKVSRRASDTSAALTPRRIAAGLTTRLFQRKAEDLVRRLGELAALGPAQAPPVRVNLDDATRLSNLAASTVDAVITSPPYAGTYDYRWHHALRMRWLDLDAHSLEKGEIGARRRYARLQPRGAREAWRRELVSVLHSLARVCRKGARLALVVADSAIGGEALRADAMIASVARDAGLALLARASQRRPHFHAPTARAFREQPRAEHAIVLVKR